MKKERKKLQLENIFFSYKQRFILYGYFSIVFFLYFKHGIYVQPNTGIKT